MRIVKNLQMQIGEVDISQIKFDKKSRDDIPQVLKGVQHIYVNSSTRWKIFVMGVLRLNLNLDYDRLHDHVNHHGLIRQMLGHGAFDREGNYQLQTIKDNVRLLTPELLD